MGEEWADVKELPDVVRQALESVGYGRSNIRVLTEESVELGGGGSDGFRAFTTLVNLNTSTFDTSWGSWGGINMFDRVNAVDNDTRIYPLPAGGVVIKGTKGGARPVWAQLYVSAASRPKVITAAPPTELPKEELDGLYCHSAFKGGQYRKDELRRRRVRPSTLDALVERGLLSRNKAGATQITTAGRNAVSSYKTY